jgi:hypothetical protein
LSTGAEPVDITARASGENGVDVHAQVAAVMEGPGGNRFTYGLADLDADVSTGRWRPSRATKGMIRLEGGLFNANVNDMAEIELHQHGNRVITERFPAANQYKLQVEAFWPVGAHRRGLSLPAGIRARHPGDDGPGLRGGGRDLRPGSGVDRGLDRD